MPQSLRLFRCSELRAACDEFSPEARLGKGRFGEVFKGILDREVVAVKRMHMQGTAVLFHELKVLSCVRHQNLLPLIGFSAALDGQCLVVYPFMQTGSLSDLLQDSGRPRISSMQRVLIGTNPIFIYAPPLARRLDGGTHVMAVFLGSWGSVPGAPCAPPPAADPREREQQEHFARLVAEREAVRSG